MIIFWIDDPQKVHGQLTKSAKDIRRIHSTIPGECIDKWLKFYNFYCYNSLFTLVHLYKNKIGIKKKVKYLKRCVYFEITVLLTCYFCFEKTSRNSRTERVANQPATFLELSIGCICQQRRRLLRRKHRLVDVDDLSPLLLLYRCQCIRVYLNSTDVIFECKS